MAFPFTQNRRQFVKTLSGAAIAAPFITRNLISAPPSRVLRHASFGADGMAWADIEAICSNPFVKLVAVADVDQNRTKQVRAAFPEARIYQDWRELLDKEEKNIDSVNVSTPDHMHAVMALAAMQRGKHVYCQKPLAHDLHETRVLTNYARGKPLVTQMGIQVHSTKPYRQAVELIRSGVIGKVREVHTWSNKDWGASGPPPASSAVPDGFDWDLWLGVCEERPFVGNDYYHPFGWRARLDFGVGTFGDMGCHIFDPIFEGLELSAPLSVRSEGMAPDAWNWSSNALIRYVFPGTRHSEGETLAVVWYDGNRRPPKEVLALVTPASVPETHKRRQEELMAQGSILIGTKGVLHVPHIDTPRLYPEIEFNDFGLPKVVETHHWSDWAEACVGGEAKPLAPFGYSGPLTEAVLLGSVAVRFPHTTLQWNAAALRFDNEAEANRFVRRSYRKGWELAGL